MDRRVHGADCVPLRDAVFDGYLAYTETLPLATALMWYIENREDTPEFTEIFFRLRERHRRSQS